jgi:TPR repeat protein
MRAVMVVLILFIEAGIAATCPAQNVANEASTSSKQFDVAYEAHQVGDFAKALSILRPLAERGDAPSQWALGTMYENGEGVSLDFAEALRLFQLSSAQGYSEADAEIGGMYAGGAGVAQSDVEALKWFRRAAEHGNPGAELLIGGFYWHGHGVREDRIEALRWFRAAAEHGCAAAQLEMAEYGDNAEEVQWYLKAADQGNTYAQNALGNIYFLGAGVPRDFLQAYFWHDLAASNQTDPYGKASAGLRDAIAMTYLTLDGVSRAQEMAREWFEKHNFLLSRPSPSDTECSQTPKSGIW